MLATSGQLPAFAGALLRWLGAFSATTATRSRGCCRQGYSLASRNCSLSFRFDVGNDSALRNVEVAVGGAVAYSVGMDTISIWRYVRISVQVAVNWLTARIALFQQIIVSELFQGAKPAANG